MGINVRDLKLKQIKYKLNINLKEDSWKFVDRSTNNFPKIEVEERTNFLMELIGSSYS